MKLTEVVKGLMEKNSELAKIPVKRAVLLLRAFLSQIAKEVNNLEEGRFVVPSLGIFIVRVVQKEDKKVKRIIFRTTKGKE